MKTEAPECKCINKSRTCRCFCPKCESTDLAWEAWGSYLDKDLVCQNCNHVVDIWDC